MSYTTSSGGNAEWIGPGVPDRGGWFNMACWNGLSEAQQRELITVGVLPYGYEPAGECPWGAEVAIETQYDEAPGPRFYCLTCGTLYILATARERSHISLHPDV